MHHHLSVLKCLPCKFLFLQLLLWLLALLLFCQCSILNHFRLTINVMGWYSAPFYLAYFCPHLRKKDQSCLSCNLFSPPSTIWQLVSEKQSNCGSGLDSTTLKPGFHWKRPRRAAQRCESWATDGTYGHTFLKPCQQDQKTKRELFFLEIMPFWNIWKNLKF